MAHSRSKRTRKNWSLVSFSCSKSLNNTLSFVQCTISFLIWQTQCIVTFEAYFFPSFSFLFHNEKFELKLSAHVILLNLWLIKVFPCLTPLRFFFVSYPVKFIYSKKAIIVLCNLHLSLNLMKHQNKDCGKFLWPSQKTWTLHT